MADIRIKLDVDTSNLDASVDKSLKEIRSMGKAVGASVNDINKAFNKLGKELVKNVGADKALTTLNKKMKDQADKVADLRKEYDALDEKMTEFSKNGGKAKDWADIKQFEKVSAELKKAQTEYDQLSAAVTGATEQSKLFSKTVNGVVYEGSTARNVFMQMNAALQKMEQEGKTASVEYRNLQKAVADMSDSIGDSKKAVSNLASDTAKLDAVLGGVQAAAGGFSVFTGAVEMFGLSADDAAEAQKKLQSAIAITTGLQSVQNVFQKQSAVMLGLNTIHTKALAKAKAYERLITIKGTEATKSATIAQKAFNLVAKANPYVILAVALTTVVGALAAFALGVGRSNKEQKKAAEATKAWSEFTKQAADNFKELTKWEKEAAQYAVDMASAEGKSKREILKLREKQLEVEQRLARQAIDTNNTRKHVSELQQNRSLLAQKKAELAADKALLGGEKKRKMYDGQGNLVRTITQDTIDALQAEIDALQNYIEIGENAVEVQRQLAISAAQLAEEKRQLAIEEANANTQARRTTEDMRAELMTDEKAKQRKQTAATYDRQIEDLKTRLANEKNLTVEQREEMNNQIILLDKQKKKALEDLRRQDLNDQYNAQKEVQAKMRELTVERMEQETNDTLQALQEKAQVEKQARLDELEEQKQAWIKAQGGVLDENGKYTDESKLTKEQKDYLAAAAKNIEDIYGDGTKMLGSMIEKEIYEKYSSAFQRALKENKKFEDDIALMAGAGKDTSEAERQRNEQALAYMQDAEGGLTPEFKRWFDSLADMSLTSLKTALKEAEEELAVLKAAGAPQEWIIEAEARIAALNKEVKQAQTDIQRGPKLTAYKNLNKVLGDAASGFEALGQTGNEAFDSLMKNVADITNTVQTVVANIQTLVQSSIEGMKEGAEAGANAVKTVEKASVILAIIGAVITLTMKLAALIDDSNLSHMPEIRKDVEKLRESLRDLKREMALDVSDNDTIFGDNQLKNLQQYTKAFNDYVQTYTEGVDKMAMSGYDEERKRQLATAIGNDTKDFMNRQFDRALADVKKEGYTLADAVNQMLDTTQIKTRDGGLFRSAKYESLRSVLGEDANKIIGETEKETIKNLKTLIDTQSQLKDEQKATIEDMIRDWETYNEALEGVKGYFNDFFGGMTDSFAEAIKVGLTDGVAAGKQNFKEAVLDMLTDMYISKTIGEQFSKVFEDAGKQVESIQTNESLSPEEKLKQQTDVITDTANLLVSGLDQSMSVVEGVRDRIKEQLGVGAGELDGTLSGAIKGASQESIDLLSGYCNAVRIQQVDGINIMREQLISLSGIERNTMNTNTILAAFRSDYNRLAATDNARPMGAVA